MLLLPSLMTKKSFWTSEQRLLTSNWTKIFLTKSLMSPMHRIYCQDKAQIPVINVKKRQRKRGRRAGCLVRICRRVGKPPLPSVLLANVQSLENKLDELRLRLSYQWDIKNWNILCFTEMWLNDDTDNIELAAFSVHRQDRAATSGKMRAGGVCLFVNHCWCAMSNIKEVTRYCSPEVVHLMKSCRPH